jgi:hypothetical protein
MYASYIQGVALRAISAYITGPRRPNRTDKRHLPGLDQPQARGGAAPRAVKAASRRYAASAPVNRRSGP